MPRTAQFRALLLSMSVIALASCGSGDTGSGYAKSSAPMPPIAEMDAAMANPAPQPLEASDTLTPIMPAGGVSSTTTSVVATNEVPVAPVTTAAPGSVEERIAKLEQSVGSLRSDYNRIMPAFASLNTTNDRIQTLLDEIERDTGKRPSEAALAPAATTTAAGTVSKAQTTTVTTTTTPPPLSAPPIAMQAPAPTTTVKTETVTTETAKVITPADAPPTAIAAMKEEAPVVATAPATPPAASTTGANVTGVRIGEHGSKTRLVLDLSGKTKPEFKYDLDNAEKVLLVDLPSTGWAGSPSGKGGAAAPLVAGWNAEKGAAGGSELAIQLKKNARILSTQFLPPEGKDPARLVMDIAAGG